MAEQSSQGDQPGVVVSEPEVDPMVGFNHEGQPIDADQRRQRGQTIVAYHPLFVDVVHPHHADRAGLPPCSKG